MLLSTANTLALLLIGYSLFSALTLALTRFRREDYPGQPLSRLAGLSLLLALGALQLAHLAWLRFDLPWVDTAAYRLTLYLVAPAFFLFGRPILDPQLPAGLRPGLLWHALPLALLPLLPATPSRSLAFLIGAGYLAWLARTLYRLRHARNGYRREILLLGGVFVIALAASLFGLIQPALPDKLYFSLYAAAIGLAFVLVQLTLDLRPQLPAEVRETAQSAYATSTLGNVDCEHALAALAQSMGRDRLYADPGLSLPTLAERLGLSPHQLSELINTRLGKGFSRYLREQRVDAAKAMLLAEPSASVLSVGLSVGFGTQSNFYAAFREIEGMTPGQYRKQASGAPE